MKRTLYCALSCATYLAWLTAARVVCSSCNRIGNFLDSWFRLSMMESHLLIAEQTKEELASWRSAVRRFRAHVRGIGRGVLLRRCLHFDLSTVSLAWHARYHQAVALPPSAFWQTACGKELHAQLRTGDIHTYFWSNLTLVALLSPHLRPSLRELVSSFTPTASDMEVRPVCVIH